MRGIFIFAGIELLARFHGLFYLFGALLIGTAIKMAVEQVHKGIKPKYLNKSAKFIQGDVRNFEALAKVVKKADIIFLSEVSLDT